MDDSTIIAPIGGLGLWPSVRTLRRRLRPSNRLLACRPYPLFDLRRCRVVHRYEDEWHRVLVVPAGENDAALDALGEDDGEMFYQDCHEDCDCSYRPGLPAWPV